MAARKRTTTPPPQDPPVVRTRKFTADVKWRGRPMGSVNFIELAPGGMYSHVYFHEMQATLAALTRTALEVAQTGTDIEIRLRLKLA